MEQFYVEQENQWKIGDCGWFMKLEGKRCCTAGNTGLAITRTSLASEVPKWNSSRFATTAVGWHMDCQHTVHPTFSVSILVPLTSLIYTCTLQVLIEKWASFLFSTERKIVLLLTGFVILGGISKEITFNTVGIKPSYSYSRGWEENSLLSAVRPTCTSLAFFFLSLNSFSLSE